MDCFLCLCIQMTALKLKRAATTQEELVMSVLDFSQIVKCNKNNNKNHPIMLAKAIRYDSVLVYVVLLRKALRSSDCARINVIGIRYERTRQMCFSSLKFEMFLKGIFDLYLLNLMCRPVARRVQCTRARTCQGPSGAEINTKMEQLAKS